MFEKSHLVSIDRKKTFLTKICIFSTSGFSDDSDDSTSYTSSEFNETDSSNDSDSDNIDNDNELYSD